MRNIFLIGDINVISCSMLAIYMNFRYLLDEMGEKEYLVDESHTRANMTLTPRHKSATYFVFISDTTMVPCQMQKMQKDMFRAIPCGKHDVSTQMFLSNLFHVNGEQ